MTEAVLYQQQPSQPACNRSARTALPPFRHEERWATLCSCVGALRPFETFTESSRLNSAAIVRFRALKITFGSVSLFANDSAQSALGCWIAYR
jgi:hypothetical protein